MRFIKFNILALHASWVYIEGTRMTQAVSYRTMDIIYNSVDIFMRNRNNFKQFVFCIIVATTPDLLTFYLQTKYQQC